MADREEPSEHYLQKVRAESADIVLQRVQELLSSHDAECSEFLHKCEKLEANLREAEARNRSLMAKVRDSEASKNVVVTGLQHRVEFLEVDKANLQKQVESLTLPSPAHQVSFWSRIFGSKKE